MALAGSTRSLQVVYRKQVPTPAQTLFLANAFLRSPDIKWHMLLLLPLFLHLLPLPLLHPLFYLLLLSLIYHHFLLVSFLLLLLFFPASTAWTLICYVLHRTACSWL